MADVPDAAESDQVEQPSAGRRRRISNAALMTAPVWAMLLLPTVLFLHGLPQILAMFPFLFTLPLYVYSQWRWLQWRARTEPKLAVQLLWAKRSWGVRIAAAGAVIFTLSFTGCTIALILAGVALTSSVLVWLWLSMLGFALIVGGGVACFIAMMVTDLRSPDGLW